MLNYGLLEILKLDINLRLTPNQKQSTYWSPHLSTLFHFFKIHGWGYVKLRKENQECGNFLKICCAHLKIGVFDENYITACYILSLKNTTIFTDIKL